MSYRLASCFGRNSVGIRSDYPLTNDQLYRAAKSIFAEGKHDSRSDRYLYIPTIQVLDGLRKEGFQPFMAAQSRSRIPGKSEFTKHMIRLRQVNQIQSAEAFEIILLNSHDGTSSYQMLAGMFRFVCQNGMVTGDVIQDLRIPHRGNITDNVIDAAFQIVDDFDAVQESVETMKSTRLSLPEAERFAEAALAYKYESEDKTPITPMQLLGARRQEDHNKNDLWTTFNRIQENLMKGGQPGVTSTGRRMKTRAVTSLDNDVKLNKALWKLSERMAELKSVPAAG